MIRKIESKAVTYMEQLLEPCDLLATSFPKDNNVPLTDGEIRIYTDPDHANKHLESRVAVQIKGQEVTKFGVTFPLERDYLQGLRASGGVLFLVTQIKKKKNKEQKKGYFRFLFPGEIDQIIESMEIAQKSKSFALEALPEKVDEIVKVVRIAALKQRLGEPKEFNSLVAAQTQAFNFAVAQPVDTSGPHWIGTGKHQVAVTASLSLGFDIPITGDFYIVPEKYFLKETDLRISAGDIQYKKVRFRWLDKENVEIYLSPGLQLTKNIETMNGKVAFATADQLDVAFKDIMFLEAWRDSGIISFDDRPLKIDLSEEFISDEIKNLRKIFGDIESFFGHIGADFSRISVHDLDESTLERLAPLVNYFVYGKELTIEENEPKRYEVEIGAWKLQIVIFPGNEQSKAKIISLSDPMMGPMIVSHEGSTHSVTAYELLTPEQIAESINLHLDDMVSSYETRVDKSDAIEFANRTTLKLLQAADSQPRRRPELLSAAESLNRWCKSQNEDSLTNLINRAQILWRQGRLTAELRREIREHQHKLSGTDDESNLLRAGCYIVEGEIERAKQVLESASSSVRDHIYSFPINYLLKNPGDSTEYLGSSRETEIWAPILRAEQETFIQNAIAGSRSD